MSCTIPTETIEKTIAFHGHSCPGLAIGIRASELAFRELGTPDTINMVAVSETDMCGVDAIQYLTGCTYGKGNFMHHDYGKMAFTFYDRETGKGFRALLKDRPGDSDSYAQMRTLMGKDMAGTATEEEITRLRDIRAMLQDQLMTAELNEMFDVTPLDAGIPRPAQILESLVCDQCGESVMESRTRRYGGHTLCIPCFSEREQKI